MKILKLKIQNINSIYGSWTIDFQDPKYTENGLFLLSGKTGSGKTTIFDAICLALFGKTPRVEKVNDTINDLISVGAGECSVDLLFKAQGKKYRATWSQHRAYNNPEGSLQDVKRELIDATTGKSLESVSLTKINSLIEKIIGMTFTQFTKTMMLAQGDFSTFLKAKQKVRTELFEKIAGGKIYRKISQKVYERASKEEKSLTELQNQKSEVEKTVLTSKQIQELIDKQKAYLKEKTQLAQNLTTSEAERDWLKRIVELTVEKDKLTTDKEYQQEVWNQAVPKREQLNRAKKAEKLEGPYGQYISKRTQLNDVKDNLKEANVQLPLLEKTALESEKAFLTINAELKTFKDERSNQQPIWTQVSGLDIQIQEKKSNLDQKQIQLDDDTAEKEELDRQLKAQNDFSDSVEKDIQKITLYQNSHPEEKQLVSEFSGIQTKLDQMKKEIETIQSQETEQKKVKAALKNDQDTLKIRIAESAEKEKAFNKTKDQRNNIEIEQKTLLAGRSLDDYKKDQEQLQKICNLNATIQNLTQQRSKLVDGQPCPLCGSKHHPYALGNIPSADEDETKLKEIKKLIKKIEKAGQDLITAETAKNQAESDLKDSNYQKDLAQHQVGQSQKDLDQATETLNNLQQQYQASKEIINQTLTPYNLSLDKDDIDTIVYSLTAKRDTWLQNDNLLTIKNEEKQKIDLEISSLKTRIQEKEKQIVITQNNIVQMTSELDSFNQNRINLFGNKDPQVEENRLNADIEKAESELEEKRQQKDKVQSDVAEVQQKIKLYQQDEKRIQPEFDEIEKNLMNQIQNAGFSGIDDFTQSRIENSALQKLEEELNHLKKQLDDAQVLLERISKDLQTEQSKNLTSQTLEEVEQNIIDIKERNEEIISENTAINGQIQSNNENNKKLDEFNQKCDKQKEKYHIWDYLSYLIGSKDGDKYANYVQGLTFRHVIQLANQHLQNINDRYELIPSVNKEVLDLSVCDRYMAGEQRSTHNISGGEQFMVSLALALGISQMASRNVRVDSLFLDEGFGTLDKEMLHNAVQALVSLRQSSGKMIGIISHVEELKDQIPTKIEIESNSNGRSTLRGPGIVQNKT